MRRGDPVRGQEIQEMARSVQIIGSGIHFGEWKPRGLSASRGINLGGKRLRRSRFAGLSRRRLIMMLGRVQAQNVLSLA